MIPVQRLNHAVLYVRDADASARWYSELFGFRILTEIPGVAAFLRAGDTDNHHDLGLFTVGPDAPGPHRMTRDSDVPPKPSNNLGWQARYPIHADHGGTSRNHIRRPGGPGR